MRWTPGQLRCRWPDVQQPSHRCPCSKQGPREGPLVAVHRPQQHCMHRGLQPDSTHNQRVLRLAQGLLAMDRPQEVNHLSVQPHMRGGMAGAAGQQRLLPGSVQAASPGIEGWRSCMRGMPCHMVLCCDAAGIMQDCAAETMCTQSCLVCSHCLALLPSTSHLQATSLDLGSSAPCQISRDASAPSLRLQVSSSLQAITSCFHRFPASACARGPWTSQARRTHVVQPFTRVFSMRCALQ